MLNKKGNVIVMHRHQPPQPSAKSKKPYVIAKNVFTICFLLLAWIIASSTYASDGDLLAGTDGAIKATVNGTLKKYIYLIDAAVSIGAFMYTKKASVFFSTIALAAFMTVMLKFIGFV